MMKNSLFTTSILVAATTAAGFFGCSSSPGTSTSGSSSSSGGGIETGSSGGGSGSSGGSSGAGQTADAAACMPPSSLPSTNFPQYATVAPMANACNSMQITGFISACVAQGATGMNCASWANANSTCAGCIVQGTDAGATETGAILFDANGKPVSGNVPGCVAIADPTNGPACAAQLEPLMQCVAVACGMCTDQASFSSCEQAARASGGVCGSLSSAAKMPCAGDMGSNGVGLTKCGYGTQNELQDVINVICGTGP
ncbi:MAG TPA: hypothetical protein VF765_18920 [Polyangiaceae bacterium]